MEPKKEYKTVYFMSANSEDNELAMEEQVIVLDDGSIVIDENTTFVDEDGNPIIVNRTHTRVENEESVVVKIEAESGSPVAMETDSPTDPQEKSSEEQEEGMIAPESPNDSNKKSAVADEDENVIMEQDLQEEPNEEITEKSSSIKDDFPSDFKPVSFLKRKERGSDSEEDSTAFKSLVVFGKDMEEAKEDQVPEKVLQIPNDVEIDKLTCPYCLKTYTRTCNKLRHMRLVHKVNSRSTVLGFIRCIECNLKYQTVQKLRDHLQGKHKMRMEPQELNFPNMNGFRKWKHDVERKELCLFTLRHGRKKTLTGFKYFYACHRAGKYEDRSKGERKRMFRTVGTCKLGIMCTAAVYCEECPEIVNVTYYAHHYGHGKETNFVQLSEMEQVAIQENISNGVSYANLLGDHEGGVNDQFQVGLIKKKDIKVIKNAFDTEEYNPGLSDAESVDRWVRICCQMEDSPVLYYRQEERLGAEEQFMLIMMTEFQKHILLSSDKQVLCLDSVHRRKGGRFYLTCLVALDECEVAFPVAFCISNKVDKSVMKQFLLSVRDSTGPLSCTFFMSDSESYYREAWMEVMNDQSKWLWSMWLVDNRIKVQLRPFKGNVVKRAYCYRTMRKLLECQNVTVFETMFKNYIDYLHADPLSKNLGNFVLQRYGANKEQWAYCYHKELKLSSVIQFEVLHSTLRFCSREGRKKRLDKFIFVIMKLVRFKMLDRLTSLLDDEKISLAIDAINMCHSIGLEIPTERISSLADKIWLVRSEDEEENEYVVREFDSCPDHCALKCSECDICVHMYSCSCMHSMINANLCQHIHAVVWKFLTPHFSPMPSPAHGDDYEDIDDNDVPDFPSQPCGLFENVLKRTHDVYKKVRLNKCSMSEASLTAVMKKLDDCMDICSGKVVTDTQSDSSSKSSIFILNSLAKNSSKQTATLPQNFTMLPQNISATLSQNISAMLPQNISAMLPQNRSQYVLLLPNNSNKGACVKK